jgi:hypothetical protein
MGSKISHCHGTCHEKEMGRYKNQCLHYETKHLIQLLSPRAQAQTHKSKSKRDRSFDNTFCKKCVFNNCISDLTLKTCKICHLFIFSFLSWKNTYYEDKYRICFICSSEPFSSPAMIFRDKANLTYDLIIIIAKYLCDPQDELNQINHLKKYSPSQCYFCKNDDIDFM